MTGATIVFCTCGNEEEAMRLANAVVERRLAACVNVFPRVRSIYRWEGEVSRAEEILLLIKTTEERFPMLRDALGELHSYDTPEIVALPIAAGAENTWPGFVKTYRF